MTTENNQRGIVWLKLSQASRQTLLAAFPPKYNDVYCDHITLLFDAAQGEAADHIGKHAEAMVYAHAFNAFVQAVRVKSTLPDTYGVPHVTLSAQPGVDAFQSVAMLRGEHTEVPCPEPFSVDGTIEFVPLPR